MQSLHNIEKSGFHRGEYVGFAHGVWKIRRFDSGWKATHREGKFPSIYCETLLQVSQQLDAIQPEQQGATA